MFDQSAETSGQKITSPTTKPVTMTAVT